MYTLKIISSTIREGRKGPIIADWITAMATQTGNFSVELVDLGVLNLPLMTEPFHPMMRRYQHEHTKSWSAKIDAADAFIFVTAEYDYNYPAPLRNALEYLSQEWAYKPAGIVSYGGVSAGTRAANSLKNDLATLKIVTLTEAVHLPFFTQFIDEDHAFTPNEIAVKAAETMLRELLRWTKGLEAIRRDVPDAEK